MSMSSIEIFPAVKEMLCACSDSMHQWEAQAVLGTPMESRVDATKRLSAISGQFDKMVPCLALDALDQVKLSVALQERYYTNHDLVKGGKVLSSAGAMFSSEIFSCFDRACLESGSDSKKVLENMKKHVFSAVTEDVRKKGFFAKIFRVVGNLFLVGIVYRGIKNYYIQRQVNALCDKVFPSFMAAVSSEKEVTEAPTKKAGEKTSFAERGQYQQPITFDSSDKQGFADITL